MVLESSLESGCAETTGDEVKEKTLDVAYDMVRRRDVVSDDGTEISC